MNLQEQRITHAFNRAAATYNQHAHTQAKAGQELIRHLIHQKNNFTSVVDAGCGTGLTTTALAAAIQFASLLGVDTASALLDQAVAADNIRYQKLNFNDITGCYDLIFSNMALHWSRSLSHTLTVLHQALASDGLLAFTIPLHGTFSELHGRFATHPFLTMAAVQSSLRATGYQLLEAKELVYCEQFSDARAALRSLKLTGTHYVHQQKQETLRGKSILSQLHFNQLSYHIGIFILGKQHG